MESLQEMGVSPETVMKNNNNIHAQEMLRELARLADSSKKVRV